MDWCHRECLWRLSATLATYSRAEAVCDRDSFFRFQFGSVVELVGQVTATNTLVARAHHDRSALLALILANECVLVEATNV